MTNSKNHLPDEAIQATMVNIEHEIAFHQECLVALKQIRTGYERILETRRKERERQAARTETAETEERAREGGE